MNIRHFNEVISSKFAAGETVHDIKNESCQCKRDKQDFRAIFLRISEKAVDVFRDRMNEEAIYFKEEFYFYPPLAETNPVFKGQETELVYTAECYGNFSYGDNKLCFVIKNVTRCIKYNGKYYFPYGKGPYTIHEFIPSTLRQFYRRKINEEDIVVPNKVGTMTEKKMKEWVDYQSLINLRCEEKKLEIENKKIAFKKRLVKIAPEKVNDTYGEVVKNGISYKWNMNEDGDTGERVEIASSAVLHTNSLTELFEMLSDNKYKPTK